VHTNTTPLVPELPPLKTLKNRRGQALAYRLRPGSAAMPQVIYLHGYASDMQATKAQFLDQACANRNQGYLRFDYAGNGQSEGNFAAGTIGDWLDDALLMIDQLVTAPAVLVGSSMGGWIGLHCAKLRPEKIKAFIGIAAAPDFTKVIWNEMTAAEQQACLAQGYLERPSSLDTPLRLYTNFVTEAKQHILLDKPLPLAIPVVLLQGRLDAEVPWQTAFDIQKLITGSQAEIVMVEDGDHRLARPQDMEILDAHVVRLSKQLLSV